MITRNADENKRSKLRFKMRDDRVSPSGINSSLNYMTPAEFAAQASGGKDAGSACLENALGVSHFPTATAAAS
jgi:hypothetical protein